MTAPTLPTDCQHGCTRPNCPTYALQRAEARIAALEARVREVEAQLPDGMKHCAIVFKECEKGHGRLTATNWVQHGCPTCALAAARVKIGELVGALRKYGQHRDQCNGFPATTQEQVDKNCDCGLSALVARHQAQQ